MNHHYLSQPFNLIREINSHDGQNTTASQQGSLGSYAPGNQRDTLIHPTNWPESKNHAKPTNSTSNQHPPLVWPVNLNWQHNYMWPTNWFHISSNHLFWSPPITEKQLIARLGTHKNTRKETNKATKTKNALSYQEDRGPISMHTTLNIWLSVPHNEKSVDSVNIDMRKSNIRVSIKDLQCWESE